MRPTLTLIAVLVLTGCAGAEPAAEPSTVTVTASSQDCRDALDQADAALEADGMLLSSTQDALDAAEDAIRALGSQDPDAFDEAFAANERAKKDIETNDKLALDRAGEYRDAAKKCRG